MKKLLQGKGFVIAILAGMVTIGFFYYLNLKSYRIKNIFQPKVTLHTPGFTVIADSAGPKKENTVISGKVITKDEKPLAGVTVYIGQHGAKTEADGSFFLSLEEEGTQMVAFHNLNTNERYAMSNTYEPVLYIRKGENVNRNFVVEKLSQN